jgi:predicted enzyme related to lactoylglutathione lyase
MANPFVHVELHTKDLAGARTFYSQLFGWALQDMPMPGGGGTYTLINVGEGTGGGMTALEGGDHGSYWMAYVGVDDVRAKTAQAKALGATVLQDVLQVGDIGLMSVIRDPAGAVVAMWQAIRGQ